MTDLLLKSTATFIIDKEYKEIILNHKQRPVIRHSHKTMHGLM